MSIMGERISAVVLNWNNYEDTRRCLEDLTSLSYNPFEIILVDNGSVDGSGKRLSEEFPIEFLQLSENKGFAGGMNEGISQAIQNGADYVLLLNNDIKIEETEILQLLKQKLTQLNDVGAATPLVNDSNGQCWFAQGVIEEDTYIPKHIDIQDSSRTVLKNDYIPMCCTLIPTKVFKRVGLLDESFFLYFEDVDYAIRLNEQGYKLATITNVRVEHEVSGTTGGVMSPIFAYYFTRNHIGIINKYGNRGTKEYRAILSRFLLELVKSILYRRPKQIIPLSQGLIDGLRNENGRGPYP